MASSLTIANADPVDGHRPALELPWRTGINMGNSTRGPGKVVARPGSGHHEEAGVGRVPDGRRC